MSEKQLSPLCPCRIGNNPESKEPLAGPTFAKCCEPFLSGKAKPQTAEELLRSRYTAFTKANVQYILATHHVDTRHEVKEEEILDWAKHSTWQGLQIVQVDQGQAKDTEATILFVARYHHQGKDHEHVEQAVFKKDPLEAKGTWYFYDGKGVNPGTYVRETPKIGRNDVCHCGSGKKYKKCHGK